MHLTGTRCFFHDPSGCPLCQSSRKQLLQVSLVESFLVHYMLQLLGLLHVPCEKLQLVAGRFSYGANDLRHVRQVIPLLDPLVIGSGSISKLMT